jgi:hypothetical protein
MADPNANQDVRLQHSAAVSDREHNAPVQQSQNYPESSSMKPQEECDPQGSTSHSAFTDESERTQTHNHDDAMIDSESQGLLTSNTAAGRRDGYVRCPECLNTHLPPCKTPQEDKDLLLRDPEAYKRKFNAVRKKRNRRNRQARESAPPVRGPSRVPRPAHASDARHGSSTGRQNTPLPAPLDTPLVASPALIAVFADAARTAQPDEIAGIRALFAARGPENQTARDLSRLFEYQLAQAAEEASAAELTQE